jgi:hypothetical protein
MTKNDAHERGTPASGLTMTPARVGRLLAACLHQAIGDVLPERLEFYEFWLSSEGLRDGSIGLAPISAVLGFLRTEDAYQQVTTQAGRLAAARTVVAMCRFNALPSRSAARLARASGCASALYRAALQREPRFDLSARRAARSMRDSAFARRAP